MQQGTVKFYNRSKAFGFITPDGGGGDVLIVPASLSDGVAYVTAGQRVWFDTEPGSKGPKAVRLTVAARGAAKLEPELVPAEQITLYYDPEGTGSDAVLAALKDVSEGPNLIDYMAFPPKLEKLKQLSHRLRDHGQSLVRRSHPLFFELQLDDRFLSENDFWTAVMEHPTLINGPVVTAGPSARICKTRADLQAFLGAGPAAAKGPKSISPRLAALINGSPLPPQTAMPAGEPIQPVTREPEPTRGKRTARKTSPSRSKAAKPAPKAKKTEKAAPKRKTPLQKKRNSK